MSRAEAWRRLGGWKWTPPGFTPAYFGAPREGADRYDWRAPPLHERAWARQMERTSLAGRFALLNVSYVDARADGHVGGAMAHHPDPNKAKGAYDCLHYCLPGPSDACVHALYNLLLNNPEYAQTRARR